MNIRDWSSDVCSSDLYLLFGAPVLSLGFIIAFFAPESLPEAALIKIGRASCRERVFPVV